MATKMGWQVFGAMKERVEKLHQNWSKFAISLTFLGFAKKMQFDISAPSFVADEYQNQNTANSNQQSDETETEIQINLSYDWKNKL